jgi:NAD(P)-dependent dehydrogenase (short-subunit alcohol dehydrogenase family)
MSMPSTLAVVTGASRGIGRSLCERLARTRTVVALARSVEGLADVAGPHPVVAISCDVADPRAVAAAWTRIRAEVGEPDLLINNAGICDAGGPVWEQDPDAWWRVFEVNLRGAFLVSRAALPGMLAQGRGRIVNVASNAAFYRVWDGLDGFDYSAYMSSKAALVRLTEVMAGETAGSGIAILAVSPGTVKTDMTATADAFRSMWDEEDVWVSADRIGDMVDAIADGELDALTGRYVHAVTDDWRDLVARRAEIADNDAHTLRVR